MIHDLRRRDLSFDIVRDIVEQPLRSVRPSRRFLKMMHSTGIFVETVADIFEFSHRSFSEYAAAKHALAAGSGDVLSDQVSDPWWRQTVLFYAGLVPDASSLVERCLAGDNQPVSQLTLALECVDEAQNVDPDLRRRIESIPTQWINDSDPERRITAMEVLLSLRLRKMPRKDAIFVDQSRIAAFEYQLFLDEEEESGIFLQPDHLLAGQRLTGTDPVVGVRALDAGRFCDWFSRRDGGGWLFTYERRDRRGRPLVHH